MDSSILHRAKALDGSVIHRRLDRTINTPYRVWHHSLLFERPRELVPILAIGDLFKRPTVTVAGEAAHIIPTRNGILIHIVVSLCNLQTNPICLRPGALEKISIDHHCCNGAMHASDQHHTAMP